MIAAGFELDQLRVFVAVAEAGSMSAAAPRVFRSQSAVSDLVKRLEDACGVVLLTRGKKGVSTTPAGARLLEHARDLLARADATLRDVRGVPLKGEIHLAVTDYFRPSDIARMLQRLRSSHPELRLHVSVLKSAAIEAAAAHREAFDIGLSMTIVGGRRRRTTAREGMLVRREALRWVTAEGAASCIPRPVPLVLLPGTCSLHRFVVDLLDRRRVPFELAHSASGVAGLQLAIAAGLGVSCLNESAIAPGLAICAASERLPPLPGVEFHLLPPRRSERPCIGEARHALARLFA